MRTAKSFGRARHRKSDPLQIQISVRAKLPKGKKPSAALIQEAIRYRIDNDEDHPAFTTKIIRWRNPTRKGKNASWRQGNQADAWTTLKKWLAAARVDVIAIRRR